MKSQATYISITTHIIFRINNRANQAILIDPSGFLVGREGRETFWYLHQNERIAEKVVLLVRQPPNGQGQVAHFYELESPPSCPFGWTFNLLHSLFSIVICQPFQNCYLMVCTFKVRFMYTFSIFLSSSTNVQFYLIMAHFYEHILLAECLKVRS